MQEHFALRAVMNNVGAGVCENCVRDGTAHGGNAVNHLRGSVSVNSNSDMTSFNVV